MLSAQTYSGVVVEKNGGKPIAGVYVCLVTSNGLLVTWGYSDDKGLYEVALPHGKQADMIHFSFLGYKKVAIPLEEFPSDGKIVMESENFQLQEVKVSANRIVQKKDTLVYSVAGFSQPQDRNHGTSYTQGHPSISHRRNGCSYRTWHGQDFQHDRVGWLVEAPSDR